jgi:hypothetical protein
VFLGFLDKKSKQRHQRCLRLAKKPKNPFLSPFAPIIEGIKSIIVIMKLLTLGINHHTAPVAIREKVAFDPEFLQEALHDLRHHLIGANQSGLPEATILSTCNRTEVYCAANDASAADILHEAYF